MAVGLVILLSGVRLIADPYLLFEEKGKIGLKDSAGKVVIPAAFEALGWSDGSFSIVGQVTGYKIKDHWGLINLKKEFLSNAEYEYLTYPGGDRVIAQKKINPTETKVGCLNLRGEVSVAFQYDGIQIIGLRAIVFIKQGATYKYGLIDLNNREVIPVQFKNIYPLGTLRYAVENTDQKIALFSEEGKAITPFGIDSISSFHNSLAVIYQDLNQGVIDREGEIKIEPRYREVRIDPDGSVSSRLPNEWKVLDGENHEVRKMEADGLAPMGGNLYRISKSNLYGVVDEEFNKVLPVEYSYIGQLQGKTIIAAKKGKFGIQRLNGSLLLPFQYDSIILDGKLIRVREDRFKKSSWSMVDTFGIKKTQKPYDYIGPLTGKLFPVKNHGYWGAVDRYGEEVIHCVFDSLLEISNEQIAVKFKGLYGITNTDEDWLLAPQRFVVRLINSDCYVLRASEKIFLKDFRGNDIYFTDNKIQFRKEDMLERLTNGTEIQIDYQGRIIERISRSSDRREQGFKTSEGLTGILKDGKYGFVDNLGRLRIANRYDGIGFFNEGLASVKIAGKWGYIDKDEKIIIQPSYEEATEFNNGKALVKRAGKYGLIDAFGKQIVNIRYDTIILSPNGRVLLQSGRQQGVADKNGHVLIDTKYDRVEDLNNGYVIINRDGKFGLVTLEGVSTIPLFYDQVAYHKEKNQYLVLLISPWKKISIH